MSYASDGLTVYFGTWVHSQKAQNIARNNKVSCAVNCPYASWNDVEGLSFAATAERVVPQDELANVTRLMLEKFPQAEFVLPKAEDVVVFRLRPIVFSVLDYRKGFGHTDLVTV